MQHVALANIENFGGPDPVTGTARAAFVVRRHYHRQKQRQ
jgi:hypothetical protein